MNAKEKQKNARLLKTYGISLKEYNKMLDDQGGVCYICEMVHPRLCVDHVHILGYKKMDQKNKKRFVRGILCFMCNTGLKAFEKTKDGKRNRKQLEGTYKYFQRFKLKGEIE